MGAIYKATPDIYWGAIPPFQSQDVHRRRAAGNVYNGIDRAYFVEVNLFGRNANSIYGNKPSLGGAGRSDILPV